MYVYVCVFLLGHTNGQQWPLVYFILHHSESDMFILFVKLEFPIPVCLLDRINNIDINNIDALTPISYNSVKHL